MNIQQLNSTLNKESKILSINFNQDQGCFAIGHENGFLVYNTNPIDLRVKRNFNTSSMGNNNNSGSGIGHITMLHRTNYLALVGGGKNPKFANNKLIIWDDLKRKSSVSLEFKNRILNVLLSRIRIIVILKNHVLVYGFSAPPKKFATYTTIDNEFGSADLSVNSTYSLLAFNHNHSNTNNINNNNNNSSNLSSSSSSINSLHTTSSKEGLKYQILAFPGRSIGQIQLVDISPQGQEKNLVSIIKAHKSKIRCLALNRSGTLIASASETGTIIRIHSTHSTALLYEFRRGLDRAIITSMKFSHNDSKLAVLSDKNTLHIFNISPINDLNDLNNGNNDLIPLNRQHMLKKLLLPIPIPNYFKSIWSFCSINTNRYHNDNNNNNSDLNNDIGVLGWSGNDSVIIIWKNKKIWEKYDIIEKVDKSSDNSNNSNSNNNNKKHKSYEIIRYSWKSFDSLDD